MKYLNLFETVSDMEEYNPTDEMISYVNENDTCHVKKIYKMCSFTLHLETQADVIPLFSGSESRIDKVTIDGKPIIVSQFYPVDREGTNFVLIAHSNFTGTFNGYRIFSVATVCRIIIPEQQDEQDDPVVPVKEYSDFVDVWIDQSGQNAVVRSISDNTELMFTIINETGEQMVSPMEVWISTNTDSLPSYYIHTTEETGELFIRYNDVTEIIPYEPGDHMIEFYTFDEDMTYSHGSTLEPEKYLNYTLSKNVKHIAGWSFAGYTNHLTEIWYEGTMEEFNAIDKSSDWNVYRKSARPVATYYSVRTVHCTDGDLSV